MTSTEYPHKVTVAKGEVESIEFSNNRTSLLVNSRDGSTQSLFLSFPHQFRYWFIGLEWKEDEQVACVTCYDSEGVVIASGSTNLQGNCIIKKC